MLAVGSRVLRWLLTRDGGGAGGSREPEEVAFDPLEAPALASPVVRGRAPVQRALLAERQPRNAIVACWHRFEEQAATAGVRRQELGDVLGVHPAGARRARRPTAAAVTALADLYRAARHSAHEITEADRAAPRWPST